jgi:signal peptidase II
MVRGFSLPAFDITHNGMEIGESKPLINNFLHITLVENPGIAFGIVPGEFLKDLILVLTIALCFGFLGFLIFAKSANKKVRLAIALIFAGAAGNLFDRIFYGYFYKYGKLFNGNVVDFLDLKIFNFSQISSFAGSYVFNFADISIIAGITMLIYMILKMKKENSESVLTQRVVEERKDSF